MSKWGSTTGTTLALAFAPNAAKPTTQSAAELKILRIFIQITPVRRKGRRAPTTQPTIYIRVLQSRLCSCDCAHSNDCPRVQGAAFAQLSAAAARTGPESLPLA